ncbi:MAG: YncE family protein, partial [Acidimicrobiia bacterium]|nr:YncE family protein [Acidimicrobiia bacterium]
LAVDEVWVPNFDDGTLTVIDPNSLEVVETVPLGGNPTTPTEFRGLVWVAEQQTDRLLAVDPTSREVVAAVPVGVKPANPTVAAERLYVPNRDDGTVSVVEVTAP